MTKSSRAKAGAGASGGTDHIVTIPHEDIPNTGDPKPAADAVVIMSTEEVINLELVKFNFPDAAIAKLKEEYGGLTIKDVNDKSGYQAVKKAWLDVRSKRTGLEKKGLELRNQYKVITSAIGKEEDRLINLISPLEEELENKWKAIDEEKLKAEKQREQEENDRVNKRLELLVEAGIKFSNGFYGIGDTITVDVATLRTMPEDNFGKLLTAVKNKAAEIKLEEDRKAEELRLQQEQQRQEQEKLQQEKDKLEQDRKEFERQKQEMAAMSKLYRTNALLGLGLTYDAKAIAFVEDDGWQQRLVVDERATMELTVPEFDAMLTKIKSVLTTRRAAFTKHQEKVKQEQAEKDRREKFIAKLLQEGGMRYDYTNKVFHFHTEDTETITTDFNEFAGLDDAAIEKKAKDLAAMVEASKTEQARINQERATAAEKERMGGLADKEKLAEYVDTVKAITELPWKMKTKKWQTRLDSFHTRLLNLLNEFTDEQP